MERTPFVKVQDRVKSWINPKTFDVLKLRDILMGNVISSTIGEVCAYTLLFQDVRGGELPSYVPDILIVAMSALEAIVTPFVSWLGFRKRRFVLVTYTLVVLLSTALLFFLPSATIREESGALLLGRVVVLVLGVRMVTELIENFMPIQISLLLFGYLTNLVKYFCVVPEHEPEVNGVHRPDHALHDRGFSVSLLRVLSRSLVLSVAMSASLLAAALWGVGYNRHEIVKVKFLTNFSTSLSLDVILRHLYIVMPIALAGVKFSVPVLTNYCTKKALKQTMVMTTFVLIFFILFTVVPKCDQGSVAGFGDKHYNYPECSLSCGCKIKFAEFNPVCVMNNMTTFLSPCHAGCSGTEIINGIQVYTGCKCSGGAAGSAGAGAALPGACPSDCRQQYILHDMLFIVATTFTLLALQAQGVLILKVVDPRDRSVGMGVLLAMVAVVTFVCGHITFLAIGVLNCQWYEGGKCHLHNNLFPYLVGICSSILVLLSAAFSIASFVLTSVYEKN